MSTEILEIVQQMDLHNAETQLALQCAPLIAGVKISNLLVDFNRHGGCGKTVPEKPEFHSATAQEPWEKARYLLFRRIGWRRT